MSISYRLPVLLFVISLASTEITMAQVKDPAYNVMLKAMLSHSVKEISVEDAILRYDAIYLDAREKEEYNVSHIKGAKYVGYDEFDSTSLRNLRRTQPVIVYCAVGYRSEKIAERLQQMGFTDVSNLYGGIFEWVNQDHPVFDSSGKKTDRVHAYDKTWGMWLRKGEKVY